MSTNAAAAGVQWSCAHADSESAAMQVYATEFDGAGVSATASAMRLALGLPIDRG